jgi:hypothetical protein
MVTSVPQTLAMQQALKKAQEFAKNLGIHTTLGVKPAVPDKQHFSEEVVINDYPQKARYKITHRDTLVS